MATTIQVSEALVRDLRAAKEEFGLATYEEVIRRLLRQQAVRAQARKLYGSHRGLDWDKERDRMRFRSEE